MSVSRFLVGKDGKTADKRQAGNKYDMGVVPFGETVLYRVLEVARDRQNAVE